MVWNFIALGIPNIEIYINEMTDQLAKLFKEKMSFHLCHSFLRPPF